MKPKFKAGDLVIASKEYKTLLTPFNMDLYNFSIKNKLLKIKKIETGRVYILNTGNWLFEDDLDYHPLYKLPLYQTLLEINIEKE